MMAKKEKSEKQFMEEEVPTSSLSREPDDWLLHGLPPQPPSLMESKYTTRYSVSDDGSIVYASWLPNGVVVIGLASSHPLLSTLCNLPTTMSTSGSIEEGPEGRKRKREDENEAVEYGKALPSTSASETLIKVDFEVGSKKGASRLEVKESGKKAGQGLLLQPGSLLAKISFIGEGGVEQSHMIRSPIAGKLLEINSSLVRDPSLLWKAPEREGHLAILFPSPAETLKAKDKLLTKEALDALLEGRAKGQDPCATYAY